MKEARDLSKGFKLPHPLDFYIDIFIRGLNLLWKGSRSDI